MAIESKTKQLQIRVTPGEKMLIKKAAKAAGMDVSSWVLGQLNVRRKEQFENLLSQLEEEGEKNYILAEINEFLTSLSAKELSSVVSDISLPDVSDYFSNYLTAMIECAVGRKSLPLPKWCKEVPPLKEAVFGSSLKSLRMHLLLNSPPPFRRRNIFIDSSVGARV